MSKLKQMKKVISLIISISRGVLPLTAFVKLLFASAPFVNIVMSGIIIDRLIEHAGIYELLTLVAFTVGANVVLSLTANALDKYRRVLKTVSAHEYKKLFTSKLLDMDYSHIEKPETHKMRATIENDENTGNGGWWQIIYYIEVILENLFGVVLAMIVVAGIFTVRSEKASFADSVWFGIIFMLIVLFTVFLTFPVDKSFFKRIYSILDRFSSGNMMFMHMNELVAKYQYGKDIRIYRASGLIDTEARRLWDEEGFIGFKALCLNDGLLKGVKAVISTITGGLVYLFIALKAVFGDLSIGQIVRYASGITEFIRAFSGLINAANTFGIVCERMQNVFAFLEMPNELYHGTLAVEKRDDRDYQIEFKNVSFKYPGCDEYVLKYFSLKFDISRRLAVVGMNGSGKTTMIKLLCRLYDPTDGVITLNGLDIRSYDYKEYMSLFSVVFQDFRLFSFPISQNVATSLEYDEAKIVDVLTAAGFGDRLAELAKGIETPLYKDFEADGVEISGGEGQKIALARALYKNAPFIILDEPTAALDPIAEYEIYSKFNELVGDRTAVYISHRLSSCRFCDDIAVFHEGRLIQRGSHDELIEDKQGKYHELWQAQAQYYHRIFIK